MAIDCKIHHDHVIADLWNALSSILGEPHTDIKPALRRQGREAINLLERYNYERETDRLSKSH